ncbi:MAG: Hpt domain-containing protein [Clostridium sp. Maddingley MBC34-26]|nr:MAG: Hpt domain-containing protein [Clostridium sp. Maddingley MBC34-26]
MEISLEKPEAFHPINLSLVAYNLSLIYKRGYILLDRNTKYDITGFTIELGLNLEEVYVLYAELISEINSAISEIKFLIDKKDITKIKKIIHNLKGVSGNYRITDVYMETSRINDMLKSENYNNLELDLNNLFNICDMAIKQIKNYFNQKSIYIDTRNVN